MGITRGTDQNKDPDLEEKIRKLLETGPEQSHTDVKDQTHLAQELSIYYQEIQYQNDELRRTSEELIQSEKQFKKLFNLAPIGYIIHSQNGEIKEVNHYMAQLLEIGPQELRGSRLELWIVPEDQDLFYLYKKQLKKQSDRGPRSVQIRLRANSGRIVPVILSSTEDPDNPDFFWTTCFDNTIEQSYKKEIQALNLDLILYKNQLDMLMEKGRTAWWSMEIATGLVSCGENKYKLLGLPVQTQPVHYTTFTNLVHPEDIDRINKAMEQTVQYGVPYEVEYRIRHRDGSYLWVRDIGFIDTMKTGQKTHVSGLVMDITLIKSLSERLGHEVNRYKILFSKLPVGLLLFKKHRLIMANKLARHYLGLTRKDMGTDFNTLFKRFKIFNKYFKPYTPKETLICHNLLHRHIQVTNPEGKVHFYAIQAICKNPERECIVSIQDITELEQTRQKISKEKNILQLFLNHIPEPVIITDTQGTIIQVNERLVHLYGYGIVELLGHNPRILNPGKQTYLNLGYTEDQYINLFSSLWESLLDPVRGTWQGRIINRTKSGKLITVQISIKTIFNHTGEPLYFVAIPYDVTTFNIETKKEKIDLFNRLVELSRLRDNETGNHMRRVGRYSALIAQKIGMSEDYCNALEIFAPMHDIGKVGIPDSILLAPRKLTADEFSLMKQHTVLGYTILSNNPELEMASLICKYHHERYDGTGYPEGLSGRAIPLTARITSISDVYDALRSRRPYKEPWPHDKAIAEIKMLQGSIFDPELVDIFVSLETIIEQIYTLLPDD